MVYAAPPPARSPAPSPAPHGPHAQTAGAGQKSADGGGCARPQSLVKWHYCCAKSLDRKGEACQLTQILIIRYTNHDALKPDGEFPPRRVSECGSLRGSVGLHADRFINWDLLSFFFQSMSAPPHSSLFPLHLPNINTTTRVASALDSKHHVQLLPTAGTAPIRRRPGAKSVRLALPSPKFPVPAVRRPLSVPAISG